MRRLGRLLTVMILCLVLAGCTFFYRQQLMASSCGIDTRYAHESGDRLLEGFILRERRGELLAPTPWLTQALRCPL